MGKSAQAERRRRGTSIFLACAEVSAKKSASETTTLSFMVYTPWADGRFPGWTVATPRKFKKITMESMTSVSVPLRIRRLLARLISADSETAEHRAAFADHARA